MSIFEEIKVGDKVAIDRGGRGFERITETLLIIAPVTKVTKTQLTAGDDRRGHLRFNRRSGWEIGAETRSAARIMTNGRHGEAERLMTPEEAEAKNREVKRELDHKALARTIRDTDFHKLPWETLLKLAEAIGIEAPNET